MSLIATLLIGAGIAFAIRAWRKAKQRQREAFLDHYRFPERLHSKLLQRYPHLTTEQGNKVLRGLREYFQLCRLAGNKRVAMPSQAVDVAWHEFILYTQQYAQFCRKGLGRFLHHTPNDALRNTSASAEAMTRTWRLACARVGLAPHTTRVLPWLFTLDTELSIADGFSYRPDCGAAPGSIGADNAFCVSHFSCSSGGDTSSTSSTGCSSDSGSSGCSSGCGGGGD